MRRTRKIVECSSSVRFCRQTQSLRHASTWKTR